MFRLPTVAAAQLALQPYLLYIKLAVCTLIVAAIFGAGAKVGSSLTATRYEAREAKQAREYQSALAHAREAERRSYEKAQEVSRDYQTELARLRDRPVSRVPARLCVSAPAPGRVPAAGTAPGGPSAAVPAGGVVQSADGTDTGVRAGPDIGPALRGLARRADEVSAQGRAVQAKASGE